MSAFLFLPSAAVIGPLAPFPFALLFSPCKYGTTFSFCCWNSPHTILGEVHKERYYLAEEVDKVLWV